MMNQIPKKVREEIYELIKYPEIELVVAYGSRARGDNQQNADIDLAVKISSNDPALWLNIKEQIEKSSLLPMDIVRLDGQDKQLEAHIIRDGKILFINQKWFISMQKLADAMLALEQNAKIDDDEIHMPRNATIQCFEFVIEIFWKTFKHLLEHKGVNTNFPREAISAAFQAGWVADEAVWQEMLDARNETSHTYKESVAEKIYQKIRFIFLPTLKQTYADLQNKFASEHNLREILSHESSKPN